DAAPGFEGVAGEFSFGDDSVKEAVAFVPLLRLGLPGFLRGVLRCHDREKAVLDRFGKGFNVGQDGLEDTGHAAFSCSESTSSVTFILASSSETAGPPGDVQGRHGARHFSATPTEPAAGSVPVANNTRLGGWDCRKTERNSLVALTRAGVS